MKRILEEVKHLLMFNEKSFQAFEEQTLEGRMKAIRSEIQPVFQELDDSFKDELEKELGTELFVHIAQHRRRTVHPPANTWSALSQQKRGYKMEPHFQLGIWPDYVFMWLSIIDQPPGKEEMGRILADHRFLFEKLPADFVINQDHTVKDYQQLTSETLEKVLKRLIAVKKSELQVGRIIKSDSEKWQDPQSARAYMMDTYRQLLPIYQLLMSQMRTTNL